MTITFNQQKDIQEDQLKVLYTDVQWYAYTRDIELLQQAVAQSLDVISVWDGENLIGLIRTIGDGLTIIYIQDLLVLEAYQNRGIASQLMERILAKYKHVRQKVLLTEEAANVRHFYEKHGFQSCDKGTAVAFAKME